MQILIEPKKPTPKNALPENPNGYPSFPKIIENGFVGNNTMSFVHPAEKPQFNYAGFRAKINDRL